MNMNWSKTQTLAQYLPIALLALIPMGAVSQSVEVNFATPLVLAPTETAGAWYVDRYAPCGFSDQEIAPDGTRNTLEQSICPSGYQAPDSFYNTQGRDYDLVANTLSTSIELYVPSSWATANERKAGFWATAIDTSATLGDYPIIEFQGPITSDLGGPGYYANGGVAGFYGWDNTANGGNGGWDLIGLPANFRYNSWVELTITLKPGVGFEYLVSDPIGRRGVSISSPFSDANDATLGSVLLEGYNYDQSYSIFWNDLTMSSSTLTCSLPPKKGPFKPFGGHHRP